MRCSRRGEERTSARRGTEVPRKRQQKTTLVQKPGRTSHPTENQSSMREVPGGATKSTQAKKTQPTKPPSTEAGRWSALSTREVRRSWWPASMSRQRKHADVTTTLSIFERSDLRAYSSVTLLPPAETESVARRRASRRRTEPTSEQKTAVHSPHRSARRRFLPCRDCGRTSERSGEVGSGGRSRSGKGDSSAKVTPREPSAGSPRSSEASGQVDAPSKLGGKGSASGSSFQDPCSAGRESPLRPATPPLVPSRVM
mmetsp:Transcript_27919/g.92829  ORF Transcript_27919/g.92829 Transcript_27919/m.92829 type:complete len:256 (-) Transcript_27919:113-880(-)